MPKRQILIPLLLSLIALLAWRALAASNTSAGAESLGGLSPFGADQLVSEGALSAHYAAFRLRFPPGTRFVHVAWLTPGTSTRIQIRSDRLFPNEAGHALSLFVSLPTYRAYWATRTPLPYNDLPWREKCRDEAPLHVFSQTFPYPGSVLWCSGVPGKVFFPEKKGTSFEAGGSYRYAPDLGADARLRLGRWTPIFGATTSDGQETWGGLLAVAPTRGEAPPKLPQTVYDATLQSWRFAR